VIRLYTILIVDDEQWVRERLKSTIDWTKLGIRTVLEAEDGEHALRKMEEVIPDIVVTDIRMPVLDGLDFTKLVKERFGDKIAVILISGYNDFAYAQRALKIGASDYILKPIQEEDLISVITRCLADIEQVRGKEAEWLRIQEKLQKNDTLLKNEFFIKLVEGGFASGDSILQAAGENGFRLDGRSYACIVIDIDQLEMLNEDNRGWNKELLQFSVVNICAEIVQNTGQGYSFLNRVGEVICLIVSELQEEEEVTQQTIAMSESIHETCRRLLRYSLTVGIGNCVFRPEEIPLSFENAVKAVSLKRHFGTDKIYDLNNPDLPKIRLNYSALQQQLNALVNHIKNGEEQQSLSTLGDMMLAIQTDNPDMYPVHLRLLYMDIINSIFKALPDSIRMDFSEEIYRFFDNVDKIHSLEEVSTWLQNTIKNLLSVLKKQSESKKKKVVSVALQYIDEHYHEPISLTTIAGKLFHNASYFCKIFKDETGEPFQKYVMKIRIKKAKELLQNPLLKVYEVAKLVGYEDERYFTKIFKEFEGISPTQFRNLQ
jgi:two-component system response regulator YesN